MPKLSALRDAGPVHGALLTLTAEQFAALRRSERGYAVRTVLARPYACDGDGDGGAGAKPVEALCFVSGPLMLLRDTSLPPPRAYLSRIRQGAAERGLDARWQAALEALDGDAVDVPEGAELPAAYRDTRSEALPAAIAAAALAGSAAVAALTL